MFSVSERGSVGLPLPRRAIRANRCPYQSPKNFDGKVLQTVALPAATHLTKNVKRVPRLAETRATDGANITSFVKQYIALLGAVRF